MARPVAALFRGRSGGPADADTIDAGGKYVIPGAVDAHTHMELPFGGTAASDTFDTGTRAAAIGGTTTIIDFAVQRTGEVVQDGLAALAHQGAGNCHIDYGFHMILGGVDDEALKAMDQLVATRASPASSCSWRTRACSTATTARSCAPCRRPATTAP
jgi:dihydropyrimidinase